MSFLRAHHEEYAGFSLAISSIREVGEATDGVPKFPLLSPELRASSVGCREAK